METTAIETKIGTKIRSPSVDPERLEPCVARYGVGVPAEKLDGKPDVR